MIVSLACCLRLSLLGSACKCTEQGSVAEVIDGIEPAKLQAALQGRTVKEAHRKGKHMWLEFDSGPCLMLHFGKHTVIFEAKFLLAYAAFTGYHFTMCRVSAMQAAQMQRLVCLDCLQPHMLDQCITAVHTLVSLVPKTKRISV